ncbi:MAG: hypothetical protein JNK49_16885 [Planctomycetes bacterium]|nr:hypothetical protein [Planctomycetota bacterium]
MIDDEQFARMFEGDCKGNLEELAKSVVVHLVEDPDGRLDKERADTAAFVERLRKRWQLSLKLTDLFLHTFMELGQKINEEERPKAVQRNNAKFEAIIRNHAAEGADIGTLRAC